MQTNVTANKKIVWASVIVGLLMIFISLRMMLIFPSQAPLPAGFSSPIIAFEFAKSPADIAYLSGDSIESSEFRDRMRKGHHWDMAFPFAYAGFLFLLLLSGYKKGHTLSLVGMLTAVSIIAFDINENLVLLGLVEASQYNSLQADLFSSLHIATWLKWGAIAVVVFTLVLQYVKNRRWLLALAASIYVALAAVGFFVDSMIATKPKLLELMALSLSVYFMAAFVSQARLAIVNSANS
jgi:hypothetical protein